MDVFASSRMDSLAVESRSWKIDLGDDFVWRFRLRIMAMRELGRI
jgi:hypothetical protein